MLIGVPKEIKPQENRVGLTADSVKRLVSEGNKLVVETCLLYTSPSPRD